MENEQQQSEKNSSEKPLNSRQTSAQAEVNIESKFQLKDLIRLTYEIGDAQGHPQALDCWSSSATQFQAFISQFGTTENVDVNAWGPFDRLEYVNGLWQFCQENGFTFPFQVNPVAQPGEKREREAR